MGTIRSFEDLVIKGFDVEEGIRLCAGDEAIYMELSLIHISEPTRH